MGDVGFLRRGSERDGEVGWEGMGFLAGAESTHLGKGPWDEVSRSEVD